MLLKIEIEGYRINQWVQSNLNPTTFVQKLQRQGGKTVSVYLSIKEASLYRDLNETHLGRSVECM